MRAAGPRRLAHLTIRRVSSALIVMLLFGSCSSTVHSSHFAQNAGGTSTSTAMGSATTTGPAPATATTTSGASTTAVPTSPPAWCASGNVAAKAGPAYSVYGNGEAVDVTVSQVGRGACRIPSVVTVVLTDKNGTAISSAQSEPQSGTSLTLAAGQTAKLRIDWVSQGCFSTAQVASGGELEWATPQGSPSSLIQELGQASVAPCHSAFGVSDLQPVL